MHAIYVLSILGIPLTVLASIKRSREKARERRQEDIAIGMRMAMREQRPPPESRRPNDG